MRPLAQRFVELASTSRTFPAITDLLAVVQHEVDRFFFLRFLAYPFRFLDPLLLPACLLKLLLTAAAFSPLRHHLQTWRWLALSSYATAASRGQSWAACVTVQAPFTACSL